MRFCRSDVLVKLLLLTITGQLWVVSGDQQLLTEPQVLPVLDDAKLESVLPGRLNLHHSECTENEECVPAARCPFYTQISENVRTCVTLFNTDGVCCPGTVQAPSSKHQKRSIAVDYAHVSANALEQGRQEYAAKIKAIKSNRNVMVASGKPESRFHQYLQVAEPEAHSGDDVYERIFASRSFADATNMTLEQRQRGEFGQDEQQQAAVQGRRVKRCLPAVPCDPHARYRTFDGSCNNLLHTRWGSAGYPFHKLLPPAYEDGVWAPRSRSVTGRPLTSARTISATLLPDFDNPHESVNLLFMQFGQFITHDMSRSSSIKIGGSEIECCTNDGSRPLQGDQLHFACLPIDVSPNDPFYSKFGVRCLNFVRLELAREGKCGLGYARQVNRVSHFIDASTVYGSSRQVADSLRTFNAGQLRNSFPVGIEHPAISRDPSLCEPWARVCFEAGDDRINQIISLVQVQTLFLREHNRVARALGHVNPNWDDETIYQEARRIVIAEVQKIFYNEYLPLLLSEHFDSEYGLSDRPHGYSNTYNPRVKPVVLSEVSGAAFRFGHSTVDGVFRVQHRSRATENVPIHTTFNNPTRVLDPDSFNDYMFSLGNQPQQHVDQSVTFGLTRMLFAGMQPFGSDLAALNIQRGRDHALRPFNDYRAWAGLPKLGGFHQVGLAGEKLSSVYESTADIDLWVGGLFESARAGSIVGPTFGHLIAENFARLKHGDRYYYANGPEINPGAFTPGQLQQIQKVTLASVICANVDTRVDFYQAPNAFLKSGAHNVPIPCGKYPKLQFEAWKH